ncbi:unnamed protein product [Sphenostylis stenocarpa]|uniref:Uncharacterized protein n=1 Tax=Sphenostylis stenocarpa TaxID=92480 RepID=A0AA86V7A5_9FABA|nr:unnamed protein product [Sphenostylis stenocarpa]
MPSGLSRRWMRNAHKYQNPFSAQSTINMIKHNIQLTGGAPILAASGGIFKGSTGEFIGDFSTPMGTNFAFYAKLEAAMLAIELALIEAGLIYG